MQQQPEILDDVFSILGGIEDHPVSTQGEMLSLAFSMLVAWYGPHDRDEEILALFVDKVRYYVPLMRRDLETPVVH
jgi:hypothetical protein